MSGSAGTERLLAFLEARLRDDEAFAQAVTSAPEYEAAWAEPSSGVLHVGPGSEAHPLDGLQPMGDSRLTAHISRHDPATVLVDVAADRELIGRLREVAGDAARRELMGYESGCADGFEAGLELAVKIRAGRFSGHPDYLEEFRP